MKKVKMKCKRGMALLLAAALTVGMVPFFPGNAVTAHAAGTSEPSSLYAQRSAHSHDDISFDTVLTADGGTLAAGDYYLDSDLSRAITINNGIVNLCLNGHTLTGAGDFSITVGSGGTLNLYDCGTDGKITGHKVQSRKGAVVYVNGGTFNMHNGTITGAWIQSADGGGVYVNSGTFNMSGGKITENQNQSGKGGGVFVNGGTFHMSGGIISNNKSNYGVYLYGGSFTVSGAPVITGNERGDVYLPVGKTITVTGTLSDTAHIEVTTETLPVEGSPVAVTGTNSADYSEYFVSDKTNYKIQNSGDGSAQVVQLFKPHVHSYTYSGDGAVITESCTCGHSETAALSMADGVNLTYTGNAIEACRITYSDGWESGTLNLSYSNNINAGRATATISKNGETASLNFDIAEKSLADNMVTIASGPHNYTGSAVTPDVMVKDGSKILVSGTDYTVSYANNTNAGTATVTVTGKGNYTGIIEKTFDIILTDADQVKVAKKVVDETLERITATNGTTKQEIQDRINMALTQAGITGVTVTVGDLSKTDATIGATGSIRGSVSIQCGSETESVSINKSIAKLPPPDDGKVATAKTVVQETLAGMTATNETTKDDIQRVIDTALTNAGITDVTVTVGNIDKTEATTDAAGSIDGSITIVSDNDLSVNDSVLINKTIERLELPVHTHTWTWIITKAATADENGEMTGICICGEVMTETIPKTGESGSGTVIVKEDAENECNGVLEDKEDVKSKVSLTDTEKEQLNTGEDLVIILRLRDVDVAVDTQEKTEIQDKLEANTLGTFLDIELLKQIGGTETKITETTEEIEITFEIPVHIRNTDETVTRTYQIMRNHDGVVDILDVENYDETAHLLTFKTDKFSTYALVYRDDVKSEPKPTPGATDIPVTPTATPGATDVPVASTETPGTTATPDQTKPAATPETVSEEQTVSKEIVEKNELSLNARLKVSQTGKKINIKWGKVAGADGYDVYVQYCGKKFTKKSITAIKSGMITKVTVKKVNGKPLNLKKNYKIYIRAYKLVGGKKVILGKTVTVHIVGRKNTKYTNVKAVKVKKKAYSLKKGRTATIKASTVLESKGKKQLSNAHAKEFRYATDKKEVATVSRKGKIKAVGKGSCTIYVYARNGYAKEIKVKVN